MAKKNFYPKNKKNNLKKFKKENKAKKVEIVFFREGMNVSDLASAMNVSNALIIKKLMNMGMMTSINEVIDRDTIEGRIEQNDNFKDILMIC